MIDITDKILLNEKAEADKINLVGLNSYRVDLGNHRKRMVIFSGPVNYKDEFGKLHVIDMQIKTRSKPCISGNTIGVEKGIYEVGFPQRPNGWISMKFKDSEVQQRFVRFAFQNTETKEIISIPKKSSSPNGIIDKNTIIYKDAHYYGVEIKYKYCPIQLKQYITLSEDFRKNLPESPYPEKQTEIILLHDIHEIFGKDPPYKNIKPEKVTAYLSSDENFALDLSIDNGLPYSIVKDVVKYKGDIIIDPTFTAQPAGAAGIDNWTEESAPAVNHGADAFMSIRGSSGANARRHGLIQFDISSIPSNAKVASSELDFTFCIGVGNIGVATINLHRITATWTELGSTWATEPADDAVVHSSQDTDGTEAIGDKFLFSNLNSNDLINNWIDGTWTNYGFKIEYANEALAQWFYLDSSDSVTADERPKLIIEYYYEYDFAYNLKPITLFEIVDEDLYIANEAITSGSGNDFANSYTDEVEALNGLGMIHKSIPPAGGVGSVGNIALTLLNQEGRSDIFDTKPYLENDEVKIHIIFDTGSSLVYADKITIMTGVIDDYIFNESNFVMPIIDASRKYKKELPLTEIDIGTYPNADPDSIGNPIQMIYGDFSSGAFDVQVPGFCKFVPACGLVDIMSRKYLISDHELFSIITGGTYIYSSGLDVFMRILDYDIDTQTLSNITTISGAPSYVELGRLVLCTLKVVLKLRHEYDTEDIADYSNILDGNTGTDITVGTGAAIQWLFLTMPDALNFASTEFVDDAILDQLLTVKFGAIGAAGTAEFGYAVDNVYTKFPFSTTNAGNGDVDVNDANNICNFYFTNNAADPPKTWDELRQMGFGIKTDNQITVKIQTMHIEMRKLTAFQPERRQIRRYSGTFGRETIGRRIV